MDNQYAERDIMALDKAGGHYCRHLSAMTGEGLHDKSDIAAELAYRDARIAELEEREAALAAHVEHMKGALHRLATYPGDCDEDDYRHAQALVDSAATTSLVRRDAEQQKIGAASFKSEAHNASVLPVRVHLEGVFSVWMSKHERGLL
ncbi:MAG: hypothetical protein CME80_08215 [Halomonas sp.]|nr:hypothetical protein [Halomonas sp.]MBF57687.1 hypothetical protein [Halomonas sp.]|tara:strand:- start:3779 stop:4222 length:444 start_codon:yes stop_codon:yes gene_type:complete